MPEIKTDSIPRKKGCGGANIDRVYTPVKGKTWNFDLEFDEAIKLYLAMQDCVLRLNKTNFSTAVGKRARMTLTVHLKVKRITVGESKAAKKPRT